VCAEFVEVESGRKTSDVDRPELAAALAACKRQKAVLLVAKLDRLARSVYFVSGLMQNKVKFMAVDLPEASDITVHLMAAFGEYEAKRIRERTKEALAVAKARGVVLGAAGPANLRSNIEERKVKADAFALKLKGLLGGMQARNLSQRAMVVELNGLGVRAARGGVWSLGQLQRTIGRITEIDQRLASQPATSRALVGRQTQAH